MTRQREKGKVRKQIAGLSKLRTAAKARISSKPCVEGQEYLDLYVLKRDRARWDRLRERAEDMIRGIDKALDQINPPSDVKAGDRHDASRVAGTIDFQVSAEPKSRTRTGEGS